MKTCLQAVVISLAAATLMWSQDSAADDETTAVEQVIVTATRTAVPVLQSPAAVGILNANDLRMQQQVRTTPESLRSIPGVMVQKTGHGQGSPYIRGFTGFRTLFMIDGVRLNNSTFRDGPNQYWNTVDSFSIGRLELVKGPASVLYGSDAIGGTANALTPDAEDLTTGPIATTLLYRYSSAEAAHVGRIEAAGLFANGLGLRAGLSVKDFGNLSSAAGTQQKTNYPERDVDLKLSLAQYQGRWTLAHQKVAIDNAWRTHRTVYGQSFAGTEVGNEKRRSLNQRRDLTYLRYAHFAAGPFSNVTATLSFQKHSEDRTRIRTDDRRDWQGTDVRTTGLSLDAGVQGFGRWLFGAEYYRDEVDSFRQDFNSDGSLNGVSLQGPVADDARYTTGGVYIQNQIDTGDITWTTGARYTRSSAAAAKVEDPQTGQPFRIDAAWDAVVGSLRATYRPHGGDWVVFGGLSQGFRAPNLSDLTRLDTARSNEIEVPSAHLEPEDFFNYELGVRLVGPRWSTQLAVFHTDFENLITRTPTGRIIEGNSEVTKVNSGDGYMRGVELEATYQFGAGLALFGTLTWLDGETLTFPTQAPIGQVEPIDRLMPTTLMTGLRWTSANASRWLELEVVHADKATRLSSRDRNDTQRIPAGGTPGYTTTNLRSSWVITDRMRVAIALENLTNENYRIHGSGLNEPGRNLVLSLMRK